MSERLLIDIDFLLEANTKVLKTQPKSTYSLWKFTIPISTFTVSPVESAVIAEKTFTPYQVTKINKYLIHCC